jgi:hypothetical protein
VQEAASTIQQRLFENAFRNLTNNLTTTSPPPQISPAETNTGVEVYEARLSASCVPLQAFIAPGVQL